MGDFQAYVTDGGVTVALRGLRLCPADKPARDALRYLNECWDAAVACRALVSNPKTDDKAAMTLVERAAQLKNAREAAFIEFMVAFLSAKHGKEEIEGTIVPSCVEEDIELIIQVAREGTSFLTRLQAVYGPPPASDKPLKTSS